MSDAPSLPASDDEWGGLQPKIALRLPYVRWLRDRNQQREASLSAEVESLSTEMEKKSSEIIALRQGLPALTDLVWEPWYPSLEAAREEISAAASESGFPDLYRTEEVLYWLHIPGWIAQWAKSTTPTRILDIGAGYGTLAVFCSRLTRAKVHCLDIESHRLAASVIERHGLVVRSANIETTDLASTEPMDAVVMTEVLEHFNFHPVPTMKKIAASLVPDGRLFLSTPDAASWGRVDGSPESYRNLPAPDPTAPTEDRHIYQFFEDEIRELLADSGFRVLHLDRAPGRWGLHLNVEAAVI